jgi:molecular chaperone DnaK
MEIGNLPDPFAVVLAPNSPLKRLPAMLTTHAVGIDLGTTYSCIAYLNEHGEPVTLNNQEGESSTPSVVLFDENEVVVGTEALRNSIVNPESVVQNSKRYIGKPNHRWTISGKPYTPVDIATFVLKKLVSAAQEQIGEIEQAVITVPAQFSDAQRQATMEAGVRAGLKRVDIINEPVAAALCYVLGSEGLWFTELADAQQIMVYDLGGGTFDLSLVRYEKNEVSVIAGSGDLNLGGIDWNHALEKAICDQFARQFKEDPRTDPESLQFISLEAEQTKRSLTVRPRAAMTCQHGGHRKTYQVEQTQFEKLTKKLVDRTGDITKRMLKDNKLGWAHVDVVLTTGGASRMPMIRNMIKSLSGRTLNTSLSPDQSIAHGATYYAGMLLTNSKFAKSILNEEATSRLAQVKQHSITARGLGIFVRDLKSDKRVPHYLIPANTALPASVTQHFGTVKPDQRRVHLQIIESGTDPEDPAVKLGACIIDDLPPNLPVESQIAVTIRYDEQARVHVSAKDVTSGKEASTEIIRQQNVVPQLESPAGTDVSMLSPPTPSAKPAVVKPTQKKPAQNKPAVKSKSVFASKSKSAELEKSDQPVPLCNRCGEPLSTRGECPSCGPAPAAKPSKKQAAKTAKTPGRPKKKRPAKAATAKPKVRAVPSAKGAKAPKKRGPAAPPLPNDGEILELSESVVLKRSDAKGPKSKDASAKPRRSKKAKGDVVQDGEDEFWQMADE